VKRFAVEIDNLVVDAAGIAPMHGEQFRTLVEQTLQQRLNNHGAPSAVAAKESVNVAVPKLEERRHAGGVRLARHVAQAIHQSLMRKV
jgi:hypothetical protein